MTQHTVSVCCWLVSGVPSTATAEKCHSAAGHLHVTILGVPGSCSHQQWELWELVLSNRLLLPASCRGFVAAWHQSVCGGRVILDL